MMNYLKKFKDNITLTEISGDSLYITLKDNENFKKIEDHINNTLIKFKDNIKIEKEPLIQKKKLMKVEHEDLISYGTVGLVVSTKNNSFYCITNVHCVVDYQNVQGNYNETCKNLREVIKDCKTKNCKVIINDTKNNTYKSDFYSKIFLIMETLALQ